MDADERALLATTLGQLASAHDGAELTKALDDFGFADLLSVAPREAVSSLFGAMGKAGSTSAALQDVLLAPLAGVGGGEARGVVLPPIGQAMPGWLEADSVTLRGLMPCQRPGTGVLLAPGFLAPAGSPGETVWVRLADSDLLDLRPVTGLDPGLMTTEVTGTAPAEVILAGAAATAAWRAVAAAGRRALAYQIVGAVSHMIELATGHARERVQFGRPVGSFQAVQHRLADAFVAKEGAAAALELSWETDDEELAAILAKSLAGRAARIAATQCQQVLAGVGFTAEHPFHRYLTRALVLDRVLGSAAELPAQIGARLASGGAIPRLAELGLANRVVAKPDVLAEAMGLAHRLAELPRPAVQETRRLLNYPVEQAAAMLDECSRAESELFDTPEHRVLAERLSRRLAAGPHAQARDK
jgi:Acyl-CoA dehydrogenase, C-terminal domain